MKQDFLKSGKCRLSTSKEEFYSGNIAFVAAKGSPLASIFNRKYVPFEGQPTLSFKIDFLGIEKGRKPRKCIGKTRKDGKSQ